MNDSGQQRKRSHFPRLGFPGGSVVENLLVNSGDTRDVGSIPGLGRSLEEGMGTHCSTLAWRIPWTEEPGGIQSMRSQESDMTEHKQNFFPKLLF